MLQGKERAVIKINRS